MEDQFAPKDRICNYCNLFLECASALYHGNARSSKAARSSNGPIKAGSAKTVKDKKSFFSWRSMHFPGRARVCQGRLPGEKDRGRIVGVPIR